MKILIAYDGSECADNAIHDLPRAGLPREAEALILDVRERWLSYPSNSETVTESSGASEAAGVKTARIKEEPEIGKLEEESPLLFEAYEKLRAYFPAWKIDCMTVQGSPAFELIRNARDWDANLIVVGCKGMTENKDFSLGSVSQKIANESHCSVRIVRGHAWKKGAPTRILIAMDGTKPSQMAVEEVASRMWMMGSEVRIVTAKDPSESNQKSIEEKTNIDRWINSFIETAKQTLKHSALGVTEVVEEGDPKSVIVRAADEWGADCIFIGSTGKGTSQENPLLGTVASAIVARAHCTVEIVRPQG
ncbi:MAG: universal stress protein [Acidobacteriota bacterium]|nr:universal stress protein [Acidobacteriota bacterium]MDH3528493.1 universal stress protein [Acidobacteriota bacterium]